MQQLLQGRYTKFHQLTWICSSQITGQVQLTSWGQWCSTSWSILGLLPCRMEVDILECHIFLHDSSPCGPRSTTWSPITWKLVHWGPVCDKSNYNRKMFFFRPCEIMKAVEISSPVISTPSWFWQKLTTIQLVIEWESNDTSILQGLIGWATGSVTES